MWVCFALRRIAAWEIAGCLHSSIEFLIPCSEAVLAVCPSPRLPPPLRISMPVEQLPCPAGSYCPSPTIQNSCGKNMASPPGSISASACIVCGPGSQLTPNGTACMPCPAGHACPNGFTKTKCAGATYSTGGQRECVTCPDTGYFTDNYACGLCPMGSYCPNATARHLCPRGRYGATEGLQSPLCSGECLRPSNQYGVTAYSCTGAFRCCSCDCCQRAIMLMLRGVAVHAVKRSVSAAVSRLAFSAVFTVAALLFSTLVALLTKA